MPPSGASGVPPSAVQYWLCGSIDLIGVWFLVREGTADCHVSAASRLAGRPNASLLASRPEPHLDLAVVPWLARCMPRMCGTARAIAYVMPHDWRGVWRATCIANVAHFLH